MYLANWQSMNSSTILSQGHHPENFPYWKFSLSSGSAVLTHRWTIFHVIPNFSIFFTTFWIYFLTAHLLLPPLSAALNSFQTPHWKTDLFQCEIFWFSWLSTVWKTPIFSSSATVGCSFSLTSQLEIFMLAMQRRHI